MFKRTGAKLPRSALHLQVADWNFMTGINCFLLIEIPKQNVHTRFDDLFLILERVGSALLFADI